MDGKKNTGHKEALKSIREEKQEVVDQTLKGQTYEFDNIEQVQEYFRNYLFRKLNLEGQDSVLSALGITNVLRKEDTLKDKIIERSKAVYAFYDSERDVIFCPRLAEDASEFETLKHNSFLAHEEMHRAIAKRGIENIPNLLLGRTLKTLSRMNCY